MYAHRPRKRKRADTAVTSFLPYQMKEMKHNIRNEATRPIYYRWERALMELV